MSTALRVCIAVAVLMVVHSGLAHSELIRNGDFSDGLQYWPQSGTYNNGVGDVVVESGVAPDSETGDPYLYMRFSDAITGAKGRYQQITEAVPAGWRPAVSADLRTETLRCTGDTTTKPAAQIRVESGPVPDSTLCSDFSASDIEVRRFPIVRSEASTWVTARSEREQALASEPQCVIVRAVALGCEPEATAPSGEAHFDNVSLTLLPPETLASGALPADDLGLPQYPKHIAPAGTESTVGDTAFLDLRQADPQAESVIRQQLAELGIAVVADKKQVVSDTIVIRLGSTDARGMQPYQNEFDDATSLPPGDLRREDGYVVEIVESNQSIDVTVAGIGDAGQLYGIQTLADLLAPDRNALWNGVIVDWPAYRYRGLIIGTRSKLNRTMRYKRNVLMLAGESGWVDEHDADFDAELRSYIDECRRRHVTCILGDAPVDRVYERNNGELFKYYANEQDVVARFERLYRNGVRRFYLSFDDIGGSATGGQDELTYEEDIIEYDGEIANAHYRYAKLVSDRLRRLDQQFETKSKLMFVPMYYWGTSNEYSVEGQYYVQRIS